MINLWNCVLDCITLYELHSYSQILCLSVVVTVGNNVIVVVVVTVDNIVVLVIIQTSTSTTTWVEISLNIQISNHQLTHPPDR